MQTLEQEWNQMHGSEHTLTLAHTTIRMEANTYMLILEQE